jgi:hypothetical protein
MKEYMMMNRGAARTAWHGGGDMLTKSYAYISLVRHGSKGRDLRKDIAIEVRKWAING